MLPSPEEHLNALGDCVWVTDHAGNRIRVPDGEHDHALERSYALIRADRRAVALECAELVYLDGQTGEAIDRIRDYSERLGKSETETPTKGSQ